MPVARSTKETFDFITKADQQLPQEKRTTFHLRRLSTSMAIRLRDLRDGEDAQLGRWLTIALRAGLAGWTNFCDPDGAPAPFKLDDKPQVLFGIELHQTASEESVNRLSTDDAQEIAGAVIKGNQLDDDDVKN